MSEQTRIIHPMYGFLPAEIEGFNSLVELALDMHWTWNHATNVLLGGGHCLRHTNLRVFDG